MIPYLVLLVLLVLVILLITDKWPAYLLFGSATLLFFFTGTISIGNLTASFSNPSILSILLLIIITGAINNHFSLPALLNPLAGRTNGVRGFLARLGIALGPLSAVMNNTPIVALLVPYAYKWSGEHKISPSKVLMPLSFLTILGGMMTAIGTSTNLILNGLATSSSIERLRWDDFLFPGILVFAGGFIWIVLASNKMLKDRTDPLGEANQNLREYLFDTLVRPDSRIAGKSVSEAGLRNLEGVFLVEILRGSDAISPVSPNETIKAGDRLFFAGERDQVLKLLDSDLGLDLPSSEVADLSTGLDIIESVVPSNSDLIGKTLKELNFRNQYDAAVIGIHRNGTRLSGKIGRIRLDKGDLLLVSAGRLFEEKTETTRNLYRINTIRKVKPVSSYQKKGVLITSFALLAAAFALPSVDLFMALVGILSIFLAFKLCDLNFVKEQISFKLFLILGSALAISKALITTGASDILGNVIIGAMNGQSALTAIAGLYFVTVCLSLFVTNAAAVAIVFPIGAAVAGALGIPTNAMLVCVAFGASCSFLTPYGYQTNLMVNGPGNYKLIDFIRLGLPLTFIYSAIILTWIYYYYLS